MTARTITPIPGQLALPLIPDLAPATRTVLADAISPGWRTRAACAGADPRLFDTTDDDQAPVRVESIRLAAARGICSSCPVRSACLAAALIGDESGVWAGTTETDRDQLRRDLAGLSADELGFAEYVVELADSVDTEPVEQAAA